MLKRESFTFSTRKRARGIERLGVTDVYNRKAAEFSENPLGIGVCVKTPEHKGQGFDMLRRECVILGTACGEEGCDHPMTPHPPYDNLDRIVPKEL